MIPRHATSTVFPYTTLFRSLRERLVLREVHRVRPGSGVRAVQKGEVRRDVLDCPYTGAGPQDRKSTRLNSSHSQISYAVFCLKKKNCTPSHVPTSSRRQSLL